MIDVTYLRASTIEEAVQLLHTPGRKLISGGTDLLPRIRKGNFTIPVLIDLSPMEALRYIREDEDWIEMGASTTHQMIEHSCLLKDKAPALVTAAHSIGCPQTRSRGTLGGNLANASPAADTAPPLLVLDAQFSIRGKAGKQVTPINKFFYSPGKTSLTEHDLITSIRFRRPTGRWGSCFLKLGKRKGMAISVASVAVYLCLDNDDRLDVVRVAYGSLAPTPIRAYTLENLLRGQNATSAILQRTLEKGELDIAPIDDIRASAEYRHRAAKVLTMRALQIAVEQAENRTNI